MLCCFVFYVELTFRSDIGVFKSTVFSLLRLASVVTTALFSLHESDSGADAGVVDRVAIHPPFSSDFLNGKKPCSILFNFNGTQIQHNVQGCVQGQVYSYNALLSSYNTEGLRILLGC